MIFLIKLVLAHLIGDFLLQPKSWVKEKETKKANSLKLYLHVLIHSILILLLTWNIRLWLPVVIIVSSHLIIDLAKSYFQKENTKTAWFVVDQLLHLIILVIVWHWWVNSNINLFTIEQINIFWIYLTAILFLTIPAGTIIKTLLSSWSKSILDGNDESLANAGKYIGILERLFVFLFIATGHWQVVGFLLAAKSVFRFGDLKESKDRKLTEYMLIGTLLSFGVAIVISLMLKKTISLL